MRDDSRDGRRGARREVHEVAGEPPSGDPDPAATEASGATAGGPTGDGTPAVATGGRPTGRTRASGQDTRRRILAAAGTLFSSRGYEQVTIRDIAAAADTDPALVIRYFGSKNDLFVLVRQPDLQLRSAPGRPLTAEGVTQALIELSFAQGTRLLDVAAIGGAQGSELIQTQLETQLVLPLMDAFGLASAGRDHIEAIAAIVAGVSLLRHRVETRGLRSLNADQLTELLTPAVQVLLDTAPKGTSHSPSDV